MGEPAERNSHLLKTIPLSIVDNGIKRITP